MNIDLKGAAHVLRGFRDGRTVLVVTPAPSRLCEAFVEAIAILQPVDMTVLQHKISAGEATITFVPPDRERIEGHSPDLLALHGEAGWPMKNVAELEHALSILEAHTTGRIHL